MLGKHFTLRKQNLSFRLTYHAPLPENTQLTTTFEGKKEDHWQNITTDTVSLPHTNSTPYRYDLAIPLAEQIKDDFEAVRVSYKLASPS